MSLPNPADDLEPPRDAAHWFARMQSGEATEEDWRAFEAWRRMDPEHDRAYKNLGYLWEASLKVPEQRLRGLMLDTGAAPKAGLRSLHLPRRRLGLALAGTGVLAAATCFLGVADWSGRLLDTVTLSTRKGERRQTALPDGSVLDLNTDTLAVVRFYDNRRLVKLRRGEAFFNVRSEAGRPFVVDAGMGRVTVTGTRFNVRRDPQALRVTVESRSVLVQSSRWWHRSERRLAAGQQAVAQADGGLGAVSAADIGSIAAWQRGKVIFDNEPLAHVIDEMNRYLAQPARLEAVQLREYRLSGVFRVDNPDAMIDALPAIAPVRVQRLADGQVRIMARSRGVVTK